MKRIEIDVDRRTFLAAAGGLAAGVAAGDKLDDDTKPFVGGPIGGGEDDDPHGDIIMPGEIKKTYYYQTYSDFKNDIGEPDLFPVLLVKDSGLEVLEQG